MFSIPCRDATPSIELTSAARLSYSNCPERLLLSLLSITENDPEQDFTRIKEPIRFASYVKPWRVYLAVILRGQAFAHADSGRIRKIKLSTQLAKDYLHMIPRRRLPKPKFNLAPLDWSFIDKHKYCSSDFRNWLYWMIGEGETMARRGLYIVLSVYRHRRRLDKLPNVPTVDIHFNRVRVPLITIDNTVSKPAMHEGELRYAYFIARRCTANGR